MVDGAKSVRRDGCVTVSFRTITRIKAVRDGANDIYVIVTLLLLCLEEK